MPVFLSYKVNPECVAVDAIIQSVRRLGYEAMEKKNVNRNK